ncbi:MAG: energy-coupling factor transporter ATPase [Succiniclasticum sp.]|jgi:energy-coupling factor transport system ATP-binding protein|nr:energy-coupling factor transporter ATPase [Succiniclasticum sp.]MEE3381683.1 energy-coupling factor transporter ATPase [Succiniclasticum sp.]MEE3479389.1 energy-coupling factor transporter ATPase [Succiniclasticum sp.]
MSIELEHVSFTYSKGTPYEKEVLHDISLTIEKGEFVAIIGHTGSGKSTLIQHLNGLLHPTKGKALLDGTDLSGKTKEARAARGKVGMVFQYPEHQLFAETVYEDVAFGPRNLGLTEDEVEQRVREALQFVGLDYDALAQRSPFNLSGGQMRRVAIAGVVSMKPDYLILDEPSAGLDPGARRDVFREILSLYKKQGIGIIMVTHSMEDALQFANRLLVVYDGRIIMDGKPAALFRERRKELQDVGLDIPEIYKLKDALRAKGLAIPETVTDTASLLKEIRKRKGLK